MRVNRSAPTAHALLVVAAIASCGKSAPAPAEAPAKEAAKVGEPPAPPPGKMGDHVASQMGGAGGPTAPAQAAPVPDSAAELPSPAGAPAAPSNVGTAYFGVERQGIVQLAGKAWKKVEAKEVMFHNAVVDPKGVLYVSTTGGVFRVEAGKSTQIGDYQNPGSVDRIALAPDGTLWAVSFTGVAHWDGKTWTKEDKKVLGGDDKLLLQRVLVDSKGVVYVLSSNALFARKDGAWSRLAPAGKATYFSEMAIDAGGVVWLTYTGGIFRLVGSEFVPFKTGDSFQSYYLIATGPDGALWVSMFDKVARWNKDGKKQVFGAKQGAFKGKQVKALAVDGSGRAWIATDFELAVIDAEGRAVTFPQGSVSEIAGTVSAIALVGGGPELPGVGTVQTGSVTGKLLRTGEAVADATVELCKSPAMIYQKTPCTGAPFHGKAQTGADGVFAVSDVPVGTYRLAIKSGAKWSSTMFECCAGMKPGKTFDIGAIQLKAGE